MIRLAFITCLSLFWTAKVSAGGLPVTGNAKVDFTREELTLLQAEFHQEFTKDFAPMGGKFEVTFFRLIPSYLAFATLQDDGTHKVAIMGGNLSRKTMTLDSLRLLICHEVGHFLGGGPRRIALDPEETQEWNVIEGAADYYATLQCMKRLLKGKDHTEALLSRALPDDAVKKCEDNFADQDAQAICKRTLIASKQLIHFFASVKKVEDNFAFDTPDTSIVEKTNPSHPDLQCRLDTLAAGAFCNKDPETALDPKDLAQGTCSDRPLCWFQPKDFAVEGKR